MVKREDLEHLASLSSDEIEALREDVDGAEEDVCKLRDGSPKLALACLAAKEGVAQLRSRSGVMLPPDVLYYFLKLDAQLDAALAAAGVEAP